MTIPTQSATFLLPPSITHEGMGDLAKFLAMQRGESVLIDGSEGCRVGAQSAQILAVARQTWEDDRVAFQISDPEGSIAESLAIMGLTDVFSSVLITDGVDA